MILSAFSPLAVWGSVCHPACVTLCLLHNTWSPGTDKGLNSRAHATRIYLVLSTKLLFYFLNSCLLVNPIDLSSPQRLLGQSMWGQFNGHLYKKYLRISMGKGKLVLWNKYVKMWGIPTKKASLTMGTRRRGSSEWPSNSFAILPWKGKRRGIQNLPALKRPPCLQNKQGSLRRPGQQNRLGTLAWPGPPLIWHRSPKGNANTNKATLGKHSWLPWKHLL